MGSRGMYEWEDYVRSLAARKAAGETLDKFEAEELAQGEMAGAVKPAKNKPE